VRLSSTRESAWSAASTHAGPATGGWGTRGASAVIRTPQSVTISNKISERAYKPDCQGWIATLTVNDVNFDSAGRFCFTPASESAEGVSLPKSMRQSQTHLGLPLERPGASES
jgi:hypothetical protein